MNYGMYIGNKAGVVTHSLRTITVNNVRDAIGFIKQNGAPQQVVFNCKFKSGEPCALDLAKWLVDKDMDLNGCFLPNGFTFSVSTALGAEGGYIKSLLVEHLSFKRSHACL